MFPKDMMPVRGYYNVKSVLSGMCKYKFTKTRIKNEEQ